MGSISGRQWGDLIYVEVTGGVEYNIFRMGERWDGDQDWQWRTTPHDEFNKFWNGTALREVSRTETRLAMPGDFVCHYGIGSGASCGTVQGVHYAPPGNGCNGPCDAVWGLIQGPELACQPRDSGGPVVSGSVAYGLAHSAVWTGKTKGFCTYVSFNTIGAIQGPNNNLEVLTIANP